MVANKHESDSILRGDVPGISRQDEEQRLQDTLDVVRDNLTKYGAQVADLRAGIDDMQAHFHDDNPELINALENAYTMYNFLENTLARNERALQKPYFGRIDIHDEASDKEETFYIGRSGIFRDVIHPMVIDWRAPVANIYYENGLGKCSYLSPQGEPLGVDLKLKRTYEIENGTLQNIFDTETIANDDILTKYLSKNKQAVLGEIVATIQKEQNDIIRKSPKYNCLVQGVAGSGKTTVAMHRISYILYNYAEQFKPEDFYIVGSNRLLLNYITGVLPDLDVYGVRQMTMEELFVRLLYEDWDKLKYRTKPTDTNVKRNMVKGRLSWFEDLKAFCRRLEQSAISRESVYLDPRQFVEGVENGKTGIYDRRVGRAADPKQLVLLMNGKGMDEFLDQYPTFSIQSKINLLNERLTARIKDEFNARGVKYTEAEKKAILRAYRGKYGPSVWKRSIYSLYEDFLRDQAARGYEVDFPEDAFDVYDLAALAYLYKRVKETEVISEAHHIVIDEAQDFGMMVYAVLNHCIKDCTYTIMGDVSQNIHFGYGLNDWEELKAMYVSVEPASFCTLKKSYRNTVEISNFATKILHHGRFAVYPVEPIIRHGDEPVVRKVRERDDLYRKAAGILRKWQEKGLETIAVVCRSEAAAQLAATELGQYIDVMENDPEKATFGNGIMVLSVEYTKGLEFDAVLILDPSREDYPVDDGHAKLLYVAATRALHELCVLHASDLTGLIADPVPENGVKMIGAETKKTSAIGFRRKTVQTDVDEDEKFAVLKAKQKITVQKPEERKPAGTQPEAEKQSISFGSMPETGLLRALGHAKTDQSVRWVTKRPDGLYLQSAYGILRISPVKADVIRITFARDSRLLEKPHPGIALTTVIREWMYRDSPKILELKTDELCLQVDKANGNIHYLDRDKRPLLSEREKECRLIEKTSQGGSRVRLYLDWPKSEKIYAQGAGTKAELPLNGAARYISHPKGSRPPMVVSERGYGLAIASGDPVLCCGISNYGTHLLAEGTEVLDYYFIARREGDGSTDSYSGLCERK
ncbi:MAG: DUF4968 domain-containing protein [Lachnospiraceae bacterium]|nr:DUF4968 domain-containing protein [Lachnospiraceae bacterium]